ncbi:uncharacterized protein BDZ83DRAFT_102180 [Colletotrichum acutatum]|uniref:Uncharacterized protein n=1 Tax=Glomerella acutata TaxID=27357 RepID=A0AAD8XK17_GLOAC|nr:uncharacterized protein BDZ83DRAFT_102180 [Colletotrichum acutatum]KAK1728790.1 hypothetical protein BDZ83DRAFT_102180 [Colletotrichum acutatum]
MSFAYLHKSGGLRGTEDDAEKIEASRRTRQLSVCQPRPRPYSYLEKQITPSETRDFNAITNSHANICPKFPMTTTPHQPPSPQPCPRQHQHQRPRATPARIFIRLRDRLQLFLERFVDGETTAQAGFRTHKAHRNARWLAKDQGPASAALAAVSNTNDDEPSRRSGKKSPVAGGVGPPCGNVGERLIIPKTREKGKGKGTPTAGALTHGSGKPFTLETTSPDVKERRQRLPPSQPRSLSRSSTLSSIVSSTLLGGSQRQQKRRRRKRERSDARPGYFDPDPSPALSKSPRVQTLVVMKEDDDRLVMNVPVELARRSWGVPVGTAK